MGTRNQTKKLFKIALSPNLTSQHSATLIMIHFPIGSIVTSSHKAYAAGTCLIKPKLARTELSSTCPSSPGHTTTLPSAAARCLRSASSRKALDEACAYGHKYPHTHTHMRAEGWVISSTCTIYRMLEFHGFFFTYNLFKLRGSRSSKAT